MSFVNRRNISGLILQNTQYLREVRIQEDMDLLVSAYSDSEEENTDQRRKRNAPGPIRDIVNESVTSVPKKFAKKRRFDHVEGNWATHVYLQFKYSHRSDISEITSLVRSFKNISIPQLFDFENFPNGLHVSLSRCFPIQYLHIHPFIDILRSSLTNRFSPTSLEFQGTEFVWNEDRTRFFLCLKMSEFSARTCVLPLIHRTDQVLERFGFPVYYKPPKPHLSILWGLPESLEDAGLTEPRMQIKSDSEDVCITLPFSEIQCKIGNQVFTI